MWEQHIKHYSNFLKLERSLSPNSLEAYVHDVELLFQFMKMKHALVTAANVTSKHLQEFLQYINELGMSAHSQARILSGIKGFYKYMLFEELLEKDPTVLIEGPKLGRKLPDTLVTSRLKNSFKRLINPNRKEDAIVLCWKCFIARAFA